MLVSLITNSVAMAIVFLFGCLGETITERVGNLNLGIPGIMCLGALGGVIGVDLTYIIFNNPGWFALMFDAIFFSALFACIGGAIYAFLTVSLQANQNVTGLVLTTFGVGLMKFIGTNLNSPNLSAASKIMKSLFNVGDKLGWFGRIFLNYGFLVYFAIILAIFASIFIKRTRIGLFLRAVGESPKTADAQGISITKYKYTFILIGSAIAGLGGMYYVMDYSGGTTFTDGPIEAFGWLAVALVIFSVWKPTMGILGAFCFGLLYILPMYININPIQLKFFDIFPYLTTVIVLIFTSIFGGKSIQPPGSLGVNYYREDR
ncbi:MAG: ABC transporter permease [Bacilli bacterium]|nr:ABC transporter permease [Bacilli bacterium]